MKVEVGLKFLITFLTQHLGLSIFDPTILKKKKTFNYPTVVLISKIITTFIM